MNDADGYPTHSNYKRDKHWYVKSSGLLSFFHLDMSFTEDVKQEKTSLDGKNAGTQGYSRGVVYANITFMKTFWKELKFLNSTTPISTKTPPLKAL